MNTTTTVRHSPAPWSCGEVEYTSTDSPVFEIRDDDDRYVASVSDEADADLVTAAPDLLAACEACMTLLIRYENRSIAPEVGIGAAINDAHAAIAKAKGRK